MDSSNSILDSHSLWNYTRSPGWNSEENEVLRLCLMKYGCGAWSDIVSHIPGKTASQLSLQTQRMIGQQSLGEYTGIHFDALKVAEVNRKKQGVHRKNNCIVNTGKPLTKSEYLEKIRENEKKFGIAPDVYSKIQISVISNVLIGSNRQEMISKLRVLYDRLALIKSKLNQNPQISKIPDINNNSPIKDIIKVCDNIKERKKRKNSSNNEDNEYKPFKQKKRYINSESNNENQIMDDYALAQALNEEEYE